MYKKKDLINFKSIVSVTITIIVLPVCVLLLTKNKTKINKPKQVSKQTIQHIQTSSFKKQKEMIYSFELWIESQRIWRNNKLVVFSPDYAHRLSEAIVKYSDYPIIMLSICYIESKFNQTAKSNTNAIGIGQVSLISVPELMKAGILTNENGKELYDLAVNIKAANFIFNQKLNKTKGDIDAALDLYSGGAKKYTTRIKKTVFDIVFFMESINKE